MFGPRVGRLTISLIDSSGAEQVFDKIDQVSVTPTRLQITATRGPKFHGEMALSEVLVKEGKCPFKKNISCSFEVWACRWEGFGNESFSWCLTSGASQAEPQSLTLSVQVFIVRENSAPDGTNIPWNIKYLLLEINQDASASGITWERVLFSKPS
ncbi:hypothetical protein RRG08_003671 [Elysia crispata]|uniref:Uncharacterized protein n=1 Tax=Elysia crispata TaxID=231223 RepID=A0AAE1E5Q6_9GAST|nr:hypothetical protein RRG08_003671 [Elysia crispata]